MTRTINLLFLTAVLLCTLLIAGCGGSSTDSNDRSARSDAVDSEAVGTPIRIMPLGDSITASRSGHSSYRRPLWHMLTGAGLNFDFVGTQHGVLWDEARIPDFDQDHEGHWGDRTDVILRQLGSWAAAFLPDIVLVHLGTNDILQGQNIAGTIADLEEVVRTFRIHNPQVIILLAQVIPSRENNGSLMALNRDIPGIAQRMSTEESPIVIVDQATGFVVWRDTWDGYHPNDNGEILMAGNWFNAIMSLDLESLGSTDQRTEEEEEDGPAEAAADSENTGNENPDVSAEESSNPFFSRD